MTDESVLPSADHVLAFWFEELKPAQWWRADPALDGTIRARFGTLHAAAARCELASWRTSAQGRVAEVIVLDQFSRNIHRGTPQAFACDAQALTLAQEALAQGIDARLTPPQLGFLCMPFMHSESRLIHLDSMRLFARPGLEHHLEAARQHQTIIERFGRYPHRNAVLGRSSTPNELAFLSQPGSSF